jgi:hypothetical protein
MRNPYTVNRNKELLPSFVCYADILGFIESSKENFNNHTESQFLSKIRKSLRHAYDRIREEKIEYFSVSGFSFKVFTDNLVIGFPVQNFNFDAGEPELGRIYQILSEFQSYLAMDGFFIRGAITYGKHYMDNNVVFGNALLQAVELVVSHAEIDG